jgi:hypothetical protein
MEFTVPAPVDAVYFFGKFYRKRQISKKVSNMMNYDIRQIGGGGGKIDGLRSPEYFLLIFSACGIPSAPVIRVAESFFIHTS